MRKIVFHILCVIVFSALYIPPPVVAEDHSPVLQSLPQQLWYTVQICSYEKVQDARGFYNQLLSDLPTEYHQYLRIEKIASFYAVRIGKSTDQTSLQPLVKAIASFNKKPLIMKAFIKEERLIAISPGDSSVAPLSTDPKDPIPPPTTQDITQKSTKQKTSPPQSAPTVDQKNNASLPVADKKQYVPQTEPAPVPTGPAPGSKEAIKILMDKYLDKKTTTTTKADVAARQALDQFTASPQCLSANCHEAITREKYTHTPVQTAQCTACHQQVQSVHPSSSGNSFSLVADRKELCLKCHQQNTTASVIHPPYEEGDCLQCHNPHGSEFPGLAKVDQTSQQELCFTCHDRAIINKKMLHGPVGLGVCTFCHSPHSAENPALLRLPPQDLCLGCHTEVAKGIAQSPYVHSIVKEKGCLSCHAAHGSDFANLLPGRGREFCYGCHQETALVERRASVKHDGLYLENKECATCHRPHFSEYRALLPMPTMKLCLTCHGNNVTLESYEPKNMEKEISGKEYLHEPVAEGECTGCHAPHGSSYPSILLGNYPTSMYAPFSKSQYDLCFRCHNQDLVDETGSSTSFRNGEINLHFTHVAIERKGRTCKACHAAHASDGPKLINRTGANFGSWTMSINFTISETGGRCTPGCHREMSYDRGTPANNSVEEVDYGKPYIDYESNNR